MFRLSVIFLMIWFKLCAAYLIHLYLIDIALSCWFCFLITRQCCALAWAEYCTRQPWLITCTSYKPTCGLNTLSVLEHSKGQVVHFWQHHLDKNLACFKLLSFQTAHFQVHIWRWNLLTCSQKALAVGGKEQSFKDAFPTLEA